MTVWRVLPLGGGGTASVAIAGTPEAGQVLHATAPVGASLQWRRNNIPISGATSADYTVTTLDQAKALTCVGTLVSNELDIEGGALRLMVVGDSFAGSLTDGLTAIEMLYPYRLAALLGAELILDGGSPIAQGGARNHLNGPSPTYILTQALQHIKPPSSAPYAPDPLQGTIRIIHASINNLNKDANIADPTIATHAVSAAIHRMQAGGAWDTVLENESLNSAFWSVSGGNYEVIPTTLSNSGGGFIRATSNGAVATFHCPSDFPGGQLRFYGPKTKDYGAVETFAIDGTPAGTVDNRGATPLDGAESWEKLLTVSAGAHTITATVSSLSAVEHINGVSFKAGTQPLVIVVNTAKAPNYPGGEHSTTDSDVNTANAALATMLATDFPSDPNVILYDLDAALGKNAFHFGPDQIHPYGNPAEPDRGTGLIAQDLAEIISDWLA